MSLASFILLLNAQASSVAPPGESQIDLVWDDAVVAFSGVQSRAGLLAQGNSLYTPRMVWHNGKTYFSYHGIYTDDGFGQGYLIVYNENNGVGRPFRVTSTEPIADSHTTPSFAIDNNGVLYMFQERTHGSPIDIYKGTDFNFFELLAEKIGPSNTLGYMNIMKDESGNGISWCRWSTDPNRNQAVVLASNGLEGWGTPRRLSTNVANDTGHYLSVPYYRQLAGDYWYVMTVKRTDDLVTFQGFWNTYWVMRTHKTIDSFVVFENIIGTEYSHDTTGNNYMTETVLNDNFLIHDSGDGENNDYIPIATVSQDGIFFMITGDQGTGDLLLHIIENRVKVTKPLNISNYVVNTARQSSPCRHLAHVDNYLEIIILILEGSLQKPHLFRSDDLGDTWVDHGDMIPEVEETFDAVVVPFNYHNIPTGRNFSIAFTRDDSATTKAVYLKRAAKGSIASETPSTVVAASDYSDAFDLLRYKAVDGSITRSGNDVTALTDLFGLRNATGVNNPQWNGSDAIALNGSTQSFSIPTTGLTALTKVTFFAIAKVNTPGAQGVLLSFSNTASPIFLNFSLYDVGLAKGPNLTYRDAASGNLKDVGQSDTDDGNYYLIAIQIDGRCKTDLFVNGTKQYYESNGFAGITDYAKRGKMTIGTINSINIGLINWSSTDVFGNISFKEIILKNTVYDYATFRGLEKKLADDHGITLNYGYQ